MSSAHDWYPGRLRELSREECFELLTTRFVGRVAFCSADGPVVLPVNFAMHGEAVVFRTAPQNIIARHVSGQRLAFEVDEVDDFTQSGWSVLVQGTGEVLESPVDLPASDRPEPWAEGTRTLYVQVNPREVSGRRVFPS